MQGFYKYILFIGETAWTACEENDFVCGTKDQCVPIGVTCNGIANCLDGSDEDKLYCGKLVMKFIFSTKQILH